MVLAVDVEIGYIQQKTAIDFFAETIEELGLRHFAFQTEVGCDVFKDQGLVTAFSNLKRMFGDYGKSVMGRPYRIQMP